MVVYTLNIRGGGGMPLYTGVGGAVKEMKDLSIGTGGAIKKAKNGYVGIGGVVKPFFESNPLDQVTGLELVLESYSYDWNNASSGIISISPPQTLYSPDSEVSDYKPIISTFTNFDQKGVEVVCLTTDNRRERGNRGNTQLYYNIYTKGLVNNVDINTLLTQLNEKGLFNSLSCTVPNVTAYLRNTSYSGGGGGASCAYTCSFFNFIGANGTYPLIQINRVISKADWAGRDFFVRANVVDDPGYLYHCYFGIVKITFPTAISINGKSLPLTFRSKIQGVSF